MTDYYEELGIDRQSSTDDVNEKLSELEAKWIRRETVNPDMARDMLSLISEAKNVFKDDSARKDYDRQLKTDAHTSSGGEGSGGNANKADIDRWFKQAQQYYNRKEYDMAAEVIEEIFDRTRPSDRNNSIYALAADVYDGIGQYDSAIKYINKVLTKNASAENYNRKAEICLHKVQKLKGYGCDDTLTQMQYALEDALKVASNDKDRSISYGLFAAVYWDLGSYNDAKRNAEQAVQHGDEWGLGQQVLDTIKHRDTVNTYSNLMPAGFVLFFIIDILTIILIPASGGVTGILMLILSLCAAAFLTFSAWVYPYGGGCTAWSIILTLIFGLVITILFGNNYDINEGIPVFELFVMLAVTIVFSIVGRTRRNAVLK